MTEQVMYTNKKRRENWCDFFFGTKTKQYLTAWKFNENSDFSLYMIVMDCVKWI